MLHVVAVHCIVQCSSFKHRLTSFSELDTNSGASFHQWLKGVAALKSGVLKPHNCVGHVLMGNHPQPMHSDYGCKLYTPVLHLECQMPQLQISEAPEGSSGKWTSASSNQSEAVRAHTYAAAQSQAALL